MLYTQRMGSRCSSRSSVKSLSDGTRHLYLEYAHGDKLFTPVEQIDKITRYVGPEGTAPRLTRLNTSDWSRATNKARKAARKLAFDLVDLYARRSAVQGFAYQSDNDLQQQMELLFPYEETPDQLAAIADVKADMESNKPMDRLICGDVGFGKTEVALRAAFSAQMAKQVMLLSPTTHPLSSISRPSMSASRPLPSRSRYSRVSALARSRSRRCWNSQKVRSMF